jgi:hypothetical protein
MPSADAYVTARGIALSDGAARWTRVRQEAIDPASWQAANERLTRPLGEADCHRMLGFGAVLAEYMVAPVGLTEEQRGLVVELGALTNFIVAVYDQFLDAGEEGVEVLPRSAVVSIFGDTEGRGPAVDGVRAETDGCASVMSSLIARYERELYALATREEREWLFRRLSRVVLAMYDAERNSGCQVEDRQLHAKGALPFLAMAAPAWLVTEQLSRNQFVGHQRWLYRLGQFIGWIDDAVDMVDDRASGQPNLVLRSLARQAHGDSAQLTRQIAALGRSVRDQWQAWVAEGAPTAPREVDGLSLVVCSWFGGAGRT